MKKKDSWNWEAMFLTSIVSFVFSFALGYFISSNTYECPTVEVDRPSLKCSYRGNAYKMTPLLNGFLLESKENKVFCDELVSPAMSGFRNAQDYIEDAERLDRWNEMHK